VIRVKLDEWIKLDFTLNEATLTRC